VKRKSNLLFFLSSSIILLNALYLGFHGEKYKWQETLIYVLTFVALCAYAVNLVDRYGSLGVIRKFNTRFSFSLIISLGKRYQSWRRLTFGTSIAYGLICGVAMIYATEETFYSGILVLVSGIERLIYIVFCRMSDSFRLGISSNSIIISNGGLQVIQLGGISSIETKYDELLFRYKDGEVKSIFYPVAEEPEQSLFEGRLRNLAEEKGIGIKI
jgi:hypothetical protein